jgi:hypothetical protein
MRTTILAVGVLVATTAACGSQTASPTSLDSGVTGLVHLGPTCPVVQEGQPCDDVPAADVEVTVARQLPGEAYAAGKVVARGRTGADGRFRIDVAPGAYVVTAQAGMSCELMDVTVTADTYALVDVPCDTGIR